MAVASANRTGHGASIAFTTSAFVASFRSIGSFEMSRPDIDTSHLGSTTYRSFTPGDLIDAGEFQCEFLYNADTPPPYSAIPETITISLPFSNGASTTKAQIAGSGYISKWSSPELATDVLQLSTMTIKWAGGPTFTDQA